MIRRPFVDLDKHPELAAEARERLDAFLRQMRGLGVGVVGQGISLPALLGPDGGIRRDLLREQVAGIEHLAAMGFKVDVLFHWSGNVETLESRWPGITRYGGNGVRFDIDHPGARELVREVGGEVLPVLGKLDAVVAWDMANEPFFDMNEWGPHGLVKYRRWLEKRHGTIGRLNERWRTDFGSFGAIPGPPERPRVASSPGEWYDQVCFHNHRVTSFFGFFSDEIHRHVPGALVHLKSQDNSSLGPMPEAVDDGIDREALTPFCQLQGLDTRPLPVTEPRMAASDYDGGDYALHWLGQSFTYDYLTSLPPERPVVDFEYHAYSINPIRVPDLPPDHGRAALWLAHLHGMIGNMAWYWHRRWGPDPFPERYYNWWFRGSLSTQPLAAAGYFQAMLELNAFAPEVERLAAEPERPVRLFVSMPSYIHDQAHIDALHRIYEGTCFHGLRLGFLTGNMLERDGVPEDCRMIILPNVSYLTRESLAALERARKAGVGIVRYGERMPSFDAYGFPHAEKATAFLKEVPVIRTDSAAQLSRRMIRELAPLTRELPLRVERTDEPGAFGVMHRAIKIDDALLVLMINVLDRRLSVRLQVPDSRFRAGTDLLSGESVTSEKIDLPVRGVRLVRLEPASR